MGNFILDTLRTDTDVKKFSDSFSFIPNFLRLTIRVDSMKPS
jgi:hypothetical protein